jgi:hypothetical protein
MQYPTFGTVESTGTVLLPGELGRIGVPPLATRHRIWIMCQIGVSNIDYRSVFQMQMGYGGRFQTIESAAITSNAAGQLNRSVPSMVNWGGNFQQNSLCLQIANWGPYSPQAVLQPTVWAGHADTFKINVVSSVHVSVYQFWIGILSDNPSES